MTLVGIAFGLVGGFTIAGVILLYPRWPWYMACLGTTCFGMIVPVPWVYGWLAWPADHRIPLTLALVIVGVGGAMFASTAGVGWYKYIMQAPKLTGETDAATPSEGAKSETE